MESPAPPPPVDGQPGASILRWSRILIADDSPMIIHLIVAKLKRFCIRIDTVSDGQQATAAVQESLSGDLRYDLILVDSRMPVMDGCDATRRIRELGYTGPIIAMTASDSDTDRHAALDAGCTAFALKPFNWLQLFTTMRRLVPPSQ
jgi:CheY-like chemotaxis protein